jgi:hypothetical protein
MPELKGRGHCRQIQILKNLSLENCADYCIEVKIFTLVVSTIINRLC